MILKKDLDNYLFTSRKKNIGEQPLIRQHGVIRINSTLVESFFTQNYAKIIGIGIEQKYKYQAVSSLGL